jgi:hypothetical protein
VAQTPPKGYTRYTIDTSVRSRLEKEKAKLEFSHPMIADGFWYLFDRELLTELEDKVDPAKYIDTVQEYMEVVCDCMIKQDSVFLQGGIGYIGGIVFSVTIVKDIFKGEIWLAGAGFRTDKSSAFKDEMVLSTVKQSLKLQSRDSLQLDSTINGELFMESQEYYQRGEKRSNKYYMKILFGCKLDEGIVL